DILETILGPRLLINSEMQGTFCFIHDVQLFASEFQMHLIFLIRQLWQLLHTGLNFCEDIVLENTVLI
ncbi:6424_t:CDS:1, partial [Cetraspora pellucida]